MTSPEQIQKDIQSVIYRNQEELILLLDKMRKELQEESFKTIEGEQTYEEKLKAWQLYVDPFYETSLRTIERLLMQF